MATLKERYDVKSLLADGNFGEVYVVSDRQDRDMIKAMKVNPYEKGGKDNKLEKVYKAEVRFYEKITNSKYSQVFPIYSDHFSMEGSGILVIEKLGKSVHEIRNQNLTRSFCSQNVRKIGFYVYKGIQYLQEAGFLHLNIHDRTILFTEPLNINCPVKITDYGFSLSTLTRSRAHKTVRSPMNFAKSPHSSLALNLGLLPKKKDDYESLFYFVMAMMGEFEMFGNPEQIVKYKRDLYFAPAKQLAQSKFLINIWQTIGPQDRDGNFDPIPIYHALHGGGIVCFKEQLSYANIGPFLKVD